MDINELSIGYLHAKINEKYIKFFYLKFFHKKSNFKIYWLYNSTKEFNYILYFYLLFNYILYSIFRFS